MALPRPCPATAAPLSCPVLSCPALPPVLPCPVLPCLLSCSELPCPVLPCPCFSPSPFPAPQEDEGIDCSTDSETRANNWRNSVRGPYEYELFSIMIHAGSASGGHYYAYIKDLAKQEWFCFNDQSVSPVSAGTGDGPLRRCISQHGRLSRI